MHYFWKFFFTFLFLFLTTFVGEKMPSSLTRNRGRCTKQGEDDNLQSAMKSHQPSSSWGIESQFLNLIVTFRRTREALLSSLALWQNPCTLTVKKALINSNHRKSAEGSCWHCLICADLVWGCSASVVCLLLVPLERQLSCTTYFCWVFCLAPAHSG